MPLTHYKNHSTISNMALVIIRRYNKLNTYTFIDNGVEMHLGNLGFQIYMNDVVESFDTAGCRFYFCCFFLLIKLAPSVPGIKCQDPYKFCFSRICRM